MAKMSLFKKNPNETAYTGGQKHFMDVIKNSGAGELLLWRVPEEDFNTNSTLVVMPGEVAIFVKDGIVEQVFENGKYQLSTENYPFISRLRNAFSGGISTFNCVVYFVRKAHSEEILWGTDSPIQVRDKVLGIATKIRSRGSYKIKVSNPVTFLEKLIGSNVPFQTQRELNKYFATEFQSKVKSVVARAIKESDTELLGIDEHLDEFSDKLQLLMEEDVLGDYGLKCEKFTVSALDIVDDELRRKYDEIGMDATAKVRNAQADKATMDILGNDWGRQQAASILTNLSNNPGAGGIAAAGAGIGMGAAAGGVFGDMAQQMFTPVQQPAPSGNVPAEDPVEVLGKLKKLLDAGLIEQAEYDAKKAEVLSRM